MVVADLNDEDYVIRSFFEEESIRLKINDQMREENFSNPTNKKIVHMIRQFQKKYGHIPTGQELITGLNQNPGYCDDAKEQLLKILQPMGYIEPSYRKKLIEDYFQYVVSQRLMEEYALNMHEKDSTAMRGIMPRLKEALNFRLNLDMGLHYIRDTDTAIERLKNKATFVPSCLRALRLYTSQSPEAVGSCGGYVRRGLSVVGATSGGGKSMFMTNEAAFAATMGYNVVYISLELDEEKIWERVASCLLDEDRFQIIAHESGEVKARLAASKNDAAQENGNLFIKWMPTRVTSMNDIEAYLNEIESLENIKIDMLVIDYIGIMSPIPGSIPQKARTDEKIKYTAEQIRNLCVTRNIAGLTGTQFNRSGYRNKDVGLDNVAESMGLGDTADLFYAIINDPQMKAYNAVMNTIIKNRNGSSDQPFYTAVNWPHMKISDVTEEQMQELSKINVEQSMNISNFNDNQQGQQTAQQPVAQSPVQQTTQQGQQQAAQQQVPQQRPVQQATHGRTKDKPLEATITGMTSQL